MRYYHPPGSDGVAGADHRLRHPRGGWVATDSALFRLWQVAHRRTPSEIAHALGTDSPIPSHLLQPSLDVLCLAGLLESDLAESADLSSSEASSEDENHLPHPLISVIIVNYNGREHLPDCLESLARQKYPSLEIIVVDNGSTDDSLPFIEAHHPTVRILPLGENLGFSVANNRGIAAAEGDWFFLLNNDTVLTPTCLRELVRVGVGQDRVAAVVPKMRFWTLPAFINGIGNRVGPQSWGSDNFIGYLDLGQFDEVREVPSACFGAALLSRKAVEAVGPLDPAYFLYYEDADWSYRARSQGYRILAAPRAVLYHKFGASVRRLSDELKLTLVVRNRLRYTLKNLTWRQALRFLSGYAFEDLVGLGGAIYRRRGRTAGAYLYAWIQFLTAIPSILAARRQVQRRRVVGDEALRPPTPIPPPQMRGSMPLLTLESVEKVYRPWLPHRPRSETPSQV